MRLLSARGSGAASRAFVCAALLHAALLIGVAGSSRRRVPETAAPSAPPASGAELEIALDVASDLAGPEHVEPPPVKGERSAARRGDAHAAPQVFAEPSPETSPESSPEPSPASAGFVFATPQYVAPSIGLALGAPNAFASMGVLPDIQAREAGTTTTPTTTTTTMTARPAAPTPARARENVEASLRLAAGARDRALGLGPEGPVLAALQQATFASTAPVDGRALFDVVANGQGVVERVDLDTADEAREGWENVAALAREALRGRTLRVAGASLGGLTTTTVMKVEVVSSLKMPSGHDAGVNASVLGLPFRKGEGKHATKVVILDPIPKTEPVTVEIVPGYSIKVYVTTWDLLAVHGDPVDIGAKPQRVVQARLVAKRS